jgi:hypothetical protein
MRFTRRPEAARKALVQARQNVNVWSAEIERRGLDAILITASGCGTMIKDYGFPAAQRARLCGKSGAGRQRSWIVRRGVRFSPLPIVFTQAVCLASALA